MIISGAGLPLNLPGLVGDSDILLVPIVSSLRALKVICRKWKKKYNRLPDAVVVEAPNKAAGHLGVTHIEEVYNEEYTLQKVVPAIREYWEENGFDIPIIAAGGIFDHNDIHDMLDIGASGVQMGTRFVCTHESEASLEFKQCYVDSEKEDITLIKSPVGLPGRAIKNKFIEELSKMKIGVRCSANCLVECNPKKAPYCIVSALDKAQQGNLDDGIIFAGTNVYRVKDIVSVKTLMDELRTGA